MARPEMTGKARPKKPGKNKLSVANIDNLDALSVGQFCLRHGISPQSFYKFKSTMPETFRVGTRVLISREAAARWRAKRERASKTEAQPP